ncbi:23S rRNA (uracil-C(5))-methyltransferase RlmCD [Alicyclobacillus acidoterrestris]|nr:23S rRNA (uracil-C(5))-methyltransferase RlmCD [Alicyclobacillus acidoterrestris]
MADVKDSHPLEQGGTYEVTALRLNDDGEGVTTINGMTVFVPFLLPGERGNVRVVERQRRFARATLLDRYDTSPDRQDAPCPVFGACGGCQAQHLRYDAQLTWKENRVKRVAQQLGLDADAIVRDIVPSPDAFRYRNQVQMPMRFDADKKQVRMGYYGFASHQMIETDSCHLQSEAMQDTLNRARVFLTDRGADLAGLVHHVIVRESQTTGEQLVVFVVRHSRGHVRRALAEFEAPHVTSVCLTAQPKAVGPVWGRKLETLYGPGTLKETIAGLSFAVSPRSFLQIQAPVAEKMYQTVVDYADLRSTDVVIDAYCGIGTLTLLLAGRAGQAIGVEEVEASVEDAQINGEDLGVDNAEFHVGRVEDWLPKWVEDGNRADVVVFDPPRKGIDAAAIQAVLKTGPRRIVYASCNPATLQRDLKLFLAGGYRVEVMQPLDMFPQTAHLECVTLLVRDCVAQQ